MQKAAALKAKKDEKDEKEAAKVTFTVRYYSFFDLPAVFFNFRLLFALCRKQQQQQ